MVKICKKRNFNFGKSFTDCSIKTILPASNNAHSCKSDYFIDKFFKKCPVNFIKNWTFLLKIMNGNKMKLSDYIREKIKKLPKCYVFTYHGF